MKRILLLCFIITFHFNSIGQISHGGNPDNWRHSVVRTIPVEELPQLDLTSYRSEDAVNDEYKDIPYRFGVNVDVDYSSETNGAWTETADGNRVWRIAIESENALSINFVMDVYQIPQGGQVFVYSPDKKQLLGSFTKENTSPINSLAVGFVFGSKLIIEYVEPSAVLGEGYIHINQVTHGYRNVMDRVDLEAKAGPFGNSGACNINVNCPQGLPYASQKKSVALIINNGNSVCTGSLVNNTSEDATPYFLTANHCLPFTISNTNNWIFYFNHETPDCAGNEEAPTNFSISGGTTLAFENESDFALLELNEDVPDSYDVCYSGWDATDFESTVTSAYSIHHPSGDVKKISIENDAPFHDDIASSLVNQVWRINQWEEGTTEDGSSGAPLFNQSGFIIGQLAGGAAACNGTVGNGGYDYYGRFGVSWDFYPEADRSLKSWLDPLNTGQLQMANSCGSGLPGNDISINSIINIDNSYCNQNSIQPQLVVTNTGTNTISSFSYTVSINGGTPELEMVSGVSIESFNTNTLNLGSMTLIDGLNTITVEIQQVNNEDDDSPSGNIKTKETISYPFGENITVTIQFDDYPTDTSWRIEDEDGFVLITGGSYGSNDTGINESICLGNGCYTFIIDDSFENGICCSEGNGFYEISGPTSGILGEGGNFGAQDVRDFCISVSSVRENEALANAISIYPNPNYGTLNIDLTETQTDFESLSIFDVTGRKVFQLSQNDIQEQMQVNTTSLPAGLYFMQLQSQEVGMVSKRFVVGK